ncbi:MAG: glycine cleavage system aminomethyltransferase GcvT [Candidatus Marinimicrobia bacterium]|nr:glycine cleavage system aminomethyltransferase GcvT [Candidatus Neomarinimicrobiota bacterium]
MESIPQKTPFYNKHVALGAKIVPFAGFLMPIQYSGIMDEHLAVRNAVGVFDVTHMGEFIVTGSAAEKFLNKITVNDVSALEIGQVQYSAMCYPDGGIVDDLLVYRFADHYMMVVNASNIEKDFDWAQQNLIEGVNLKNISGDTALLAIQGPKSCDVLQKLTDVVLKDIPFYHFTEGSLAGFDMIISRTGYTGEKGFELYHDPSKGAELWDKIFAAGREFGIQPIGLGARDTLRLEMKYCLYGNDIDKTTNPLEAGLGWITKLQKDDFNGKAELLRIKEAGLRRKLIAFEMIDRAIPRHGYPIIVGEEEVGIVTSGTQSPSLNTGIGLGYLASEHTKPGTEILINIRGRKLKARVVKPPFVPPHTI